jgi:hypothetical protein
MTQAVRSPLIAGVPRILGASIGEASKRNGAQLLSAFARLTVHPWQEATRLARMPRNATVVRLNALTLLAAEQARL